MATSGSIDYNQTRNEIITDSLMLLGVLSPDQSISDSDLAFSDRILNKMVKAWMNQGIHLWTTTEATVFLTKGTEVYSLNSSSGDHASNTVSETTLSANEASGQTVLSVTSSTGMTASDNVGIELDDGTLQWTTIVSVDSVTQITVTASLTDDAASGNNVYAYTTRMGRPLDIIDVRLRNDNDDDQPVRQAGREEYFSMSDKDTEGDPLIYYYDPQLTTGKLYVWPAPDAVSDRLKITYRRAIEDFDAAGNNPDFPQEWLDAITYNLAVRLAPAYKKDDKIIKTLAPMANDMLFNAKSWDNEYGSFFHQPDVE